MAGNTSPPNTAQGRKSRLKRFIRTRRGIALAGTATLLAASALGLWATGSRPFSAKERYCWGAWEEDSGPDFLGDADEGSRTSEETAPTPRQPHGRCTVAIHTGYTDSDGAESVTETEVTAAYGPAPKDPAQRMEWIEEYLGDRAVPLPDGLPGATDGERGLVVLPKECDTRDGRPTAVTLNAHARVTWRDDSSPTSVGLGGYRPAGELLLSAANRGMAAAGCAPAEPLHLTSPVLTLPEKEETYASRACRIEGLEFGKKTALKLAYQVGAVTRDLQSCSVRNIPSRSRYFDALMVARPRLATLLDGAVGSEAPAPGWRGTGTFADTYKVVRAPCAGRPVTLVMLAPSSRRTTQYFTAFTGAVTQRLGCGPVAPGSSHR